VHNPRERHGAHRNYGGISLVRRLHIATREGANVGEEQMLGIDIGALVTAVVAFSARVPSELAGHVPLLDPGPIASLVALVVASGLMWQARRAAA
jgi:hypothetical protein